MKDEIKEKIKAYYIANDIDKILDYITNYAKDLEIYKSRNKKAIEFIKEKGCYYSGDFDDILDLYDLNDLLNILNGGDEE